MERLASSCAKARVDSLHARTQGYHIAIAARTAEVPRTGGLRMSGINHCPAREGKMEILL
jgi:hypothetical protein